MSDPPPSTGDRQEIEYACARLVSAFAYLVDHRRYEELVGLFVEDCRFERPGAQVEGQAELRAFMDGRPTTTVTRHICAPTFFEDVGTDEAVAVTYMTMYHAEGTDDAVVEIAGAAGIAEIHDVFRLTPSGWRIAQRRVIPAMIQRH